MVEYKLAPILAAMYATALTLDVAVSAIWPALIVALAALVPGAAYVSLINDATDLDDDRAAGKPNRLANHSSIYAGVLIAATVTVGLVFSTLWRRDRCCCRSIWRRGWPSRCIRCRRSAGRVAAFSA